MLQGSGDPAQVDLAKRLKAGLEGREMVSIIVDDTSSVYDTYLPMFGGCQMHMYEFLATAVLVIIHPASATSQ